MKILFAGTWEKGNILNGPEKYAKRLYEHAQGPHRFITGVNAGRFNILKRLFLNREEEEGTQRLGLFPLLLFVLKFRPDVIHIANFAHGYALLLFMLKFALKTRVVYTMHGLIDHDVRNYKYRLWELIKYKYYEKIFLKKSDAIIGFSEDSIKYAAKKYKVGKEKFTVFEHGIDEIFYNEEYIKNLSFKIAMYTGKSRDLKGMDNIIEFLNRSETDFELHIIGEAPNDIPLSEKHMIIIEGFLDQKKLAELLKSCDIFILGSPNDTFSIMTFEAMAAGCIPIVTRQTGISRIIREGYNGYLYNFGELERPSTIVKTLNIQREKLSEIRKNNLILCKKYTWGEVFKRHYDFYEKIIDE